MGEEQEMGLHVQARRLPKEVLVSVVRPQFQPQEYPASLTRLYNWSPDEAIPEFYTDPTVFESIHPELLDLALPDWAASPQDFVTRHRCVPPPPSLAVLSAWSWGVACVPSWCCACRHRKACSLT